MPQLHTPLGTLGFVVALAGLAVDVSGGRRESAHSRRQPPASVGALLGGWALVLPSPWRWMTDALLCLKEAMAERNEEVKVR